MRILAAFALVPLLGAPHRPFDAGPPARPDAVVPSGNGGTVQPQNCNEACFNLADEGGQIIGHGCGHGTQGWGCLATVYECSVRTDNCLIALLTTESGTMLAMDRRCQIFSPSTPARLEVTARPRGVATESI
jgi:hypothetical protein